VDVVAGPGNEGKSGTACISAACALLREKFPERGTGSAHGHYLRAGSPDEDEDTREAVEEFPPEAA
jgi:hypothetical protein